MRSDSDGTAHATWWERWGASGAVAVVLMVVAFLISGSSPDTGDPESEIVSYLSSDSNQNQNFAAFFILLAGVLFMLVFFSVLRSRLTAAEGSGGTWRSSPSDPEWRARRCGWVPSRSSSPRSPWPMTGGR